MSWQDAFTSYTTGMAFHISLSHDQASLLAHIGENATHSNWESRTGRRSFVPTVNGLIRRGLVEHNPLARSNLPAGVTIKWWYRLTPAGRSVFELLKHAGLADHQENPKQVAA